MLFFFLFFLLFFPIFSSYRIPLVGQKTRRRRGIFAVNRFIGSVIGQFRV